MRKSQLRLPLWVAAGHLLMASLASAQGEPSSLLDVSLSLDKDGHLLASSRVSKVRQKNERLFGDLHTEGPESSLLRQPLQSLPYVFLNLLLTGSGDAVSLIDARRMFLLRGFGVGHLDLGERFLKPPKDASALAKGRSHIESLLGLNLVRAIDAHAHTVQWMLSGVEDERNNLFLRQAAFRAMVESLGEAETRDILAKHPELQPDTRKSADRHFQKAVQMVPADHDLVISLVPPRIPDHRPLLRAGRQHWFHNMQAWILSHGFRLPPSFYWNVQITADLADLVPYEFASRFGNWRFDHLLCAMRLPTAEDELQVWCRAGGALELDRLRAGLKAEDIAVDELQDGKMIRATIGPVELEATSNHVTVRTESFPWDGGGRAAGALLKAGASSKLGVWAYAPRRSDWLADTGKLGAFESALLTMRFDAGPDVSVRVTYGSADAAKSQRDRVHSYRKRCSDFLDKELANMRYTRRDLERGPPARRPELRAVLTFIRLLDRLDWRLDGNVVTLTVPPRAMMPEVLVQALNAPAIVNRPPIGGR